MKRTQRLLLLVIVLELTAGGLFAARRLMRPPPPEIDAKMLDSSLAADLREASKACDSAADWRNLAELFEASGCFPESEACFRVACNMEARNPNFARQWAFALERMAFLDEANVQYQRAIDLGHPDPDACRYFIARNLLRAEKVDEARQVFTRGQALASNTYELARLSFRAGAYDEADLLLRKLVASNPRAVQVNQLGYRLEIERGHTRRAFDYLNGAHFTKTKLHTPFDEEAFRILSAATRVGPPRIWHSGKNLLNQGVYHEAEKFVEGALQEHANSAITMLQAELAFHAKQYERAIEYFEKFQTQNRPAARIVERIGDVWQAAGQPAKARASWLAAIDLQVSLDMKDIHKKLAESYAKVGDKSASTRHHALADYWKGREILQAGSTTLAIDYFVVAVKQDPKLIPGWYYLGESQRLTGKEAAATSLRTCLQLDANHGRALRSLALLEASPTK